MAKAIKKEESTISAALDQKDLGILKLLQDNARITVKEISDKVNLSTTPVYERIKWMEETGVIKQYVTLIDPAKLNKSLMVIVYVSLRQHNKTAGSKFVKTIHEMSEVLECYSISGEFDFMLKILVEDMNAYYNFHVNRLSEMENIGNVQSIFVMGIVKDTHALI
ncbi:MAG TPA: Lrp/AsnC family transcriptional regulator [Chitinophagaceae bacterium]|jgi:DNA-binding Lrp family transcriptional regulator|nr:Lrp/AsnC family transcriptional regulator [Chitinophagaceae bacterium]